MPVYAAMRKYNLKLAKKLDDQKQQTSEARKKWELMRKSLEGAPDKSLDEVCRKQIYLQLIASLYEQTQMLDALIRLKHLVNDNEGKMTVVRAKVHGIHEEPSATQTDDEVEQQVEDMEDKLRELEDASSHIDTEVNALRNKTSMIEREVKKCKADVDIDQIDREIADARRKIDKLEDML